MADEETAPDSTDGEERHEPEQPARGRPAPRRWPVVTAVAAAVALLAGGLYGAQALSGGGSDEDGGAPAPLRLNSATGGGRDAALEETGGGAPGFAGHGGTLRLTGEVPAAPARAAEYRFGDGLGDGRSATADLAAALGLDGSVREVANSWMVSGSDPESPVLTVLRGPEGHWSYASGAGDLGTTVEWQGPDTSVSNEDSGAVGGDDSGAATIVAPPSQAEALAAVRPLLTRLGLEQATLDSSGTVGSRRIVTAEPRVAGLPVRGMTTELYVGPGGELVSGSGMLAEPVAGQERETTGARQALAALNELAGAREAQEPGLLPAPECLKTREPQPLPRFDGEGGGDRGSEASVAGSGTKGPAEMPADGGTGGSDAGVGLCQPPRPPQPVEPVAVTAEFGLAMHYSGSEPLLVPSWLFRAVGGDAAPYVVSHPAVPFEIGQESGDGAGNMRGDLGASRASGIGSVPGSPDGEAGEAGEGAGSDGDIRETGLSVETYEADGTRLTVHFWGGVCGDHTAIADESAQHEVVVTIRASAPRGGGECIAVAKRQSAEVWLERPLGDRTVVDTRGQPAQQR